MLRYCRRTMTWLDKLERRLGFLGIPGLMRIVVAFNALVFLLVRLNPGFRFVIDLDPGRIRRASRAGDVGAHRRRVDADLRILLFHFPDVTERLPPGAFDLVLAGHPSKNIAADLGIRAAKEAMWGAFTGKSDKDIEASIKPQTEKIKAAAATLCRQLPDLLSAQQKLAAAMPEFRPYATMQQKDVNDCGKDMQDMDGKQGFAVFSD